MHAWSGIQERSVVNESAVHVGIIKSMIESEITASDDVSYSNGKYFYEK